MLAFYNLLQLLARMEYEGGSGFGDIIILGKREEWTLAEQNFLLWNNREGQGVNMSMRYPSFIIIDFIYTIRLDHGYIKRPVLSVRPDVHQRRPEVARRPAVERFQLRQDAQNCPTFSRIFKDVSSDTYGYAC